MSTYLIGELCAGGQTPGPGTRHTVTVRCLVLDSIRRLKQPGSAESTSTIDSLIRRDYYCIT